MPLTEGQITPDSPFGRSLTELARESRRILEIGMGSGTGTTRCLMKGMGKPDQLLVSVEADRDQYLFGSTQATKQLAELCPQSNFVALMGVMHRMYRPYYHPVGSEAHKTEYNQCVNTTLSARLLSEMTATPVGKEWDLVVLDGGEYSSDGDFLLIWPTAQIIALDDMNHKVATKNVFAYRALMEAGWNVVAEGINDRNGWIIFSRP